MLLLDNAIQNQKKDSTTDSYQQTPTIKSGHCPKSQMGPDVSAHEGARYPQQDGSLEKHPSHHTFLIAMVWHFQIPPNESMMFHNTSQHLVARPLSHQATYPANQPQEDAQGQQGRAEQLLHHYLAALDNRHQCCSLSFRVAEALAVEPRRCPRQPNPVVR